MKKFLTVCAVLSLTSPAMAATKPTDMINVVLYEGKTEETMVRKVYSKAWKDLVLDASTRQKLMRKEQHIAKEYGVNVRLYAIRLTPKVNGGSTVVSALYISPTVMAGYDLLGDDIPGTCIMMDLDGNGGVNGSCN